MDDFEQKHLAFEQAISEAVQRADGRIMEAFHRLNLSPEEMNYLTCEVCYRMLHKVVMTSMHEVRKRELLKNWEDNIHVPREG